MLVVLPTEHILRGFLMEATTEKGRIYLWRVVTPLHRPMGRVLLEYSDRISENGKDIYVDNDAPEKSARMLGAIISQHLAYLQTTRTPRDFLQHISPMIGNSSVRFRVDLALTLYRLGDVRQCGDILRLLDREVDRLEEKDRLPVDHAIKEAARTFEADPLRLGPLLDEWEQQNVERLGLLPSRAGSNRIEVLH
jgi:hypothetical protein